MTKLTTLYARGAGDKVLQWSIFVSGDQYWSEAGQVGGALVTAKPTTAKPKNDGKANATTAAQQALVEAQAKIVKKKKENYFENVADIDKGFLEPQLAKPCKDYLEKVDWAGGQVLDDKLNGFACIVLTKGAFTRTNEQYHSIPHILAEFKGFLEQNPEAYIQGELFNPIYVTQLNKIAELIAVTRQPKDISPELLAESARIVQFHWYDGYGFTSVTGKKITQDTPLIERRQAIDLAIQHLGDPIQQVHYDVVDCPLVAERLKQEYIAKGGEGKILKNPKAPYQHKRTKDLLKLKKSEDAEFQIVTDMANPFVEGKGNSEGCAEAVWCYVKGTRADRFKVNLEGTKDWLRQVFKQSDKYKGKWITARFQEYSPYGIPLIPYSDLVLREEVEGKGAVNASKRDPLDTSDDIFDL